MYAGDTAHAVHLTSLTFRPDGLLSAATRYPRNGDDDWTPEQSAAGWYSYAQRLIDCETGYFVETAESLLDRDSVRQVSRATNKQDQIARLSRQLQEQERKWPGNSDVFLACAAASNPAVYRQRLVQAKKPLPLLSDVSLVEKLGTDTERLSALVQRRFDIGRLARSKAAPATDMFRELRAQTIAWRRAGNAPYTPRPANAREDAALLAKLNREIEAGGDVSAIQRIQGPIVEHLAERDDLGLFGGADTGERGMNLVRTDCDNNLTMPVAQGKLSKQGRYRSSKPLLARAVLAKTMGSHGGPDEDGVFNGFNHDAGAEAICAAIARHRAPVAKAADEAEPADTMAFGITPALLDQADTPAAMLLAIRAARRNTVR